VTAVEQAYTEFSGVRAERSEAVEKVELSRFEQVGIDPGDMFEQGEHVVEVIAFR